ncbi:MAG: nitroreductase family protein [Bacillota bacterium]|nr:nitroreductase family protein [Bacillota bacterium]
MESFLSLASSRRSVRKYKEADVSNEDLQYFIRAAMTAPSGCNSQCWRFVAIRNKDIIRKIELAVVDKMMSILGAENKDYPSQYIESKRKMATFFTKAPVVMAVFMTEAEYYDHVLISELQSQGLDKEGIMKLFANYDLLSIGAAIQNLLLAVQEKGYGACWMNEPAVAGTDINKILNIPENQRFISLIPIGLPNYSPREKKLKPIESIFTII